MPVARIDSYRKKDFSAITASYTVLGAAISHNWRMWRLVNGTDGDMSISVDGTSDNLILLAGTFVLYDITANTDSDASEALVMKKGTQFYVKYDTAPTSGSVYLEGIYMQGQ